MDNLFDIMLSNTIVASTLAVIAYGAGRIWHNPQLRHILWMLVLLKLMTPPLISVPIESTWFDQKTLSHSVVTEPQNRFAITGNQPMTSKYMSPAENFVPRVNWNLVIIALWLTGSLSYILITLRGCHFFGKLLQHTTAADEELQQRIQDIASIMGVIQVPKVRLSQACIPPLVWAMGLRPLVVLPRQLINTLSPDQRDTVLAHELAHIRRRDYLVRWLDVLVLSVFWWNPIAWLARHQLRRAEEESCDAWVVWTFPKLRRSYGQTMLKTIEFVTESKLLPTLAGSTFGKSFHRRRIEMIMKHNLNHRISRTSLSVALLLGFVVLPVTAHPADVKVPAKVKATDDRPKSELSGLVIDKNKRQNRESTPSTDEEKTRLPGIEEFLKVGESAAQGRLNQIDQLNSLREQIYAGVNLDQDTTRADTNFNLMMIALSPIGDAAISGNKRAMSALREAVMHRRLRPFAVITLGDMAAKGNSEALDILLNYERYNVLKSSAVSALAIAAKSGDEKVVLFLTNIVESDKNRPLWLMASNGLKAAAANGNKNAAKALAKMKDFLSKVK